MTQLPENYLRLSDKLKESILLFMFIAVPVITRAQSAEVKNYLESLKQAGKEPIAFMKDALLKADLLIFDDAAHSAQEPFDFYQQLIRDPQFNKKVKFIFIEVFSISSQPYLDRYLANPDKDSTILFPVFQNDFSGYGWRYETYFSLLKTVWELNQHFQEKEKIRVIGVDQPIFWEGIKTYHDYEVFLNSLDARDYFMYLQIVKNMNNFNGNDKGIFFTNTRHAYTDLHSKDGKLIWNCGTFFRLLYPEKTISIRIHNASLLVENQAKADRKTAEGTEGITFKWVKMDNGKWDSAFALNLNKPIAFYLQSTPFGKYPYIGNQMLNIKPGQNMLNAYDAMLFLGPIDSLHFSSTVDFIYTSDFKKELLRRIKVLYDGKTDELLKENEASTLEKYIDKTVRKENRTKNNLIRE
jgi:hypothetical protein